MRSYHRRVALLTPAGELIRHLPGQLAKQMVVVGSAIIAHENGRVRAVRLIQTAATSAQRIGPPTGDPFGTKFSVREKLDSGHTVWKHHARATDVLE